MCLFKQKGAAKYELWEYQQLFYPPMWIEQPYAFSSFTQAHNWMQQHAEVGTRFKITKNGQIMLRGTR